jgi:hypothetical protein
MHLLILILVEHHSASRWAISRAPQEVPLGYKARRRSNNPLLEAGAKPRMTAQWLGVVTFRGGCHSILQSVNGTTMRHSCVRVAP